MTYAFDPAEGAILVDAELTGPAATVELLLVLDTGATCTMVSEDRLRAAGIDPSTPTGQAHATFGGGVATLPMVTVPTLSALGTRRTDYQVVCHTLPPSAGVDGVLGLDLFPGRVLTIDFANNTLDLT
ncbi:MAG TPA: retropepsin-like aspartic protease [Gemmataceae bacterium]|jgi:hypothetical protein